MKIQRFKVFENNDGSVDFPFNIDDLKDILIDFEDNDWIISIDKGYIKPGGGMRKEIQERVQYLGYQINIDKKESSDQNIDNIDWDGGVQYGDSQLLSLFNKCIKRIEKICTGWKVQWRISSNHFTIRIIGKKIDNETGFIWHEFIDSLETKINEIEINNNRIKVMDESFSGFTYSGSTIIVIRANYPRNEEDTNIIKSEIVNDVNNDIHDNKHHFDSVQKQIIDFISKYEKDIKFTCRYDDYGYVVIKTPILRFNKTIKEDDIKNFVSYSSQTKSDIEYILYELSISIDKNK